MPAGTASTSSKLDDGVLWQVATQDASFREADRQRLHAARRSGIVDQAVGAETADAVEPLARFQVALRDADDFADRSAEGGDSGIAIDDGAADGGSDLEVRQMEGRVEDVERTVAELVIGELGLLERRVSWMITNAPVCGAAPSASRRGRSRAFLSRAGDSRLHEHSCKADRTFRGGRL